jgi:hypothetical protein
VPLPTKHLSHYELIAKGLYPDIDAISPQNTNKTMLTLSAILRLGAKNAVWWMLGLCVCCPWLSHAQVGGQILDSTNNSPIPFAHIFIPNTTYQTISDTKGNFHLPKTLSQPFELLITAVGYHPYSHRVESPADTLLKVMLGEKITTLASVVVQAHSEADYTHFEEILLGHTAFSKYCKVLNPQDIGIHFDPSESLLSAYTAGEALIIENQALGYRVYLHDLTFAYHTRSGFLQYTSKPLFEPLRPKNRQQERRWAANRQRAYLGSLQHFLAAAYAGQTAEQGFEVRALEKVLNPRRQQADSILRAMRQLVMQNPNGSLNLTMPDSLIKATSEPVYVGQFLYDGLLPNDYYLHTIDKDHKLLQFQHYLHITYTREGEEPGLRRNMLGGVAPAEKVQVSLLRLYEQAAIRLYPQGYMEDPRAILIENYWAFEKMGEFLPLDYTLE